MRISSLSLASESISASMPSSTSNCSMTSRVFKLATYLFNSSDSDLSSLLDITFAEHRKYKAEMEMKLLKDLQE